MLDLPSEDLVGKGVAVNRLMKITDYRDQQVIW